MNNRVANKGILELTNMRRKLALANIHAPEKLGNFSSDYCLLKTFEHVNFIIWVESKS